MLAFLLSFFVSLIPTLAVYRWIRSLRKDDAAYFNLCDKMFRAGVVSALPIIVVSGTLSLLLHMTGLKASHALLYEALHSFIVLALTEEMVKFLTFRRTLGENDDSYSSLDMTAMMTLVGLGFGAAENLVLAITSGVGVMLIRAVTLGHGGYGFVVGYFYGKGVKSGNNGYKALGIVLIWLMHGLYDFSLDEEFTAYNEDLSAIIAVTLAFMSVVLAVTLIAYFTRARKNGLYMSPPTGSLDGAAGAEEKNDPPQP